MPEDLRRARLEETLEVQRAISARRMEREVGRTREAIVDRIEDGRVVGRTRGQADDVDGVTWLDGAAGLPPGTLVETRVTSASDYDLQADVVREVRAAPAAGDGRRAAVRGRALPIAAGIGLDASWGR